MNDSTDWKERGVKVISGDHLDINTPQTPGMDRAAAINYATAGADKLWAGTVAIQPNAKTGVHHHGALESIIYISVVKPGCAGEMLWNMYAKQAQEILFTCLPMFLNKK